MNIGEYTVALMRAALRGEEAPALPDGVTPEDVYRFAARHKVENLCMEAFRGRDVPEVWRTACAQNAAQMVAQESAKEELRAAFNEAGILFLPMKGWYLRSMYPRPDLRFMSDIDVLIRREDRAKAAAVMRELGYTGGGSDSVGDVSFMRKPYLHVELHFDMAGLEHPLWHAYYSDIWEKTTRVSGQECALSWSDYFLYMVVNFAKDYRRMGTGIRSVLDFYVFLEKHRADLDEACVREELRRLDVLELAEETAGLAERWFGTGAAADEAMADKILTDGLHGTLENLVASRYERCTGGRERTRVGKLRYLLRRAFPPMAVMKVRYPVLEKAPVLAPLCWVKWLVQHRKRAAMEVRTLRRM